MAAHWNDEYYDNLEFFYWEPQHLGRMKNPKSKIQSARDALNHLRGIEVCLNHQMNLFFRLAPLAYTKNLFQECLDSDLDDVWTLIGRELDDLWKVKGLTQPDLFFAGSTTNVCIELKLGSKLTLEQVLKYVYLNILEQRHAGEVKKYYLLFMGKGEFKDQWNEKFQDIDSMRLALEESYLGKSEKSWASKIKGLDPLINDEANSTVFGFLNYEGFARSLSAFRHKIRSASLHSETIVELFEGMLAELHQRGLAAT